MTQDEADEAMVQNTEPQVSEQTTAPEADKKKSVVRRARRGRRGPKGKKQGPVDKRRGPGGKRRGQKARKQLHEEKKEGVTVKRMWSGGKRQYCVFCRRPQVKIARHLLRKHKDEPEVVAASTLPKGSKQRHLLLEHLRCRGNYLHNIEVIRQGSGEIIPCRQPSEEVDARNYLPCPLCLGFFLRSDLWKHQVCCRKKLVTDSIPIAEKLLEPVADIMVDSAAGALMDQADDGTSVEDTSCDTPADAATADPATAETALANPKGALEIVLKRAMTAAVGGDQTVISDHGTERPRKRVRVQAAASRLLPISGGASESCSEVLHRMNHDHISYEVKSDWLICKYGNKLMGNQDGTQKRYDYVSQKLRELGRFLLAAKSLDPSIHTLLDVLAPGHLSLALSAARKAAGYRWSRPPLAVKTTLKTICEIAIGESLQDGDWEAAAKTTDFYHMLGKEWDNLGLSDPDPDPDAVIPEGRAKPRKRVVQSLIKKPNPELDQGPPELPKTNNKPVTSLMVPDPRLQVPLPAPRKVQRRPWSSEEKEAIWRQLGVHIRVQTVPGKEVCQRCLDLEPVLRGRHWKDIKNQVHNQIQSQKKQQFHAQIDLQENQAQQNQAQQNPAQQTQGQQDQNQKKWQQHQHYQAPINQQGKDQILDQKKQQYHVQMDQHNQDHMQNQKKQEYHVQLDHQEQDHTQNQRKQQYHIQMDQHDPLQVHKKQLCHGRPDHQDHAAAVKKHLYQMGQQTQGLQSTLERDTSLLTGAFGLDGSHRGPGISLVEREHIISPYQLSQRAPGHHMDQLLPRTEWTDDSLAQNYQVNRPLPRNLLQEGPPGGPPTHPHPGHGHF